MGELAMKEIGDNLLLAIMAIAICVSCSVQSLTSKGLCVNNCFYSDTYSGAASNLPEAPEKSP